MKHTGFIYWQDGNDWLGYLDEFPNFPTQGTSLENLKDHLADLYKDLASGVTPIAQRDAGIGEARRGAKSSLTDKCNR
jgi:hypothetical protein